MIKVCPNANSNPYSQYRATAVATASPEKLLLMLYDGLLLSLRKGKQGIEQGEIQTAHNSLVKSQEIISELSRTLKPEFEISENLCQLYDYMNRRLIAANIKKDPGIVDEVLGLAGELRSAWAEAARHLPRSKPSVSAPLG